MLLGYLGWAGILFAQNYSFTYVSRARNSGSLLRHFKAAIFSNGIWIVSQILMLGPMFDQLTGKHGLGQQIASGAVYTVATVAGSLAAHFISKKTEKGNTAVGASDRYVQITNEDWAALQARVAELPKAEEVSRLKGLAEQAYDLCLGGIPDSGISAQKFGDQIITPGLESAKA